MRHFLHIPATLLFFCAGALPSFPGMRNFVVSAALCFSGFVLLDVWKGTL